jgi:hypothetical protein
MGEVKNVYTILIRKFEGNRSLRSLRPKWDSAAMDHAEIGYEVLNWTLLAHFRVQWQALVNATVNSELYKRLFLQTISFSRKSADSNSWLPQYLVTELSFCVVYELAFGLSNFAS